MVMFPSTHDNQSGLGTSDSESHMVASHYDLVKMELLQQPPAKHITKKMQEYCPSFYLH